MQSRLARTIVAVAGLIIAAPCAVLAATPRCGSSTELSIIARDGGKAAHPLAGRALFPSQPHLVNCSADDVAAWLVEAAAATHALVLGEVHDNPLHHRIRADIIGKLAAAERSRQRTASPALVFEHIRVDQAAALDAAPRATADEVLDALDWNKSGWPARSMFAPLFEMAIKWSLPITAGHPEAQKVREVARGGAEKLTADERTRLGLDTPLAPALLDDLLGELEASHCGLMPKTAFGKMAEAQRYRDGHMAAAVAAAAVERTAVLLTGNGHARKDRGVPHYLPASLPALSVLFIEVEDGKTAPDDYVQRGPDGKPVADAIVFTVRAERKDPCDEMRAMMQKKK